MKNYMDMLWVLNLGLGDNNLVKEDILIFEGVVKELLPNAQSKVLLDNGKTLICTVSGKMRKMRIRVLSQDRVKVEVSPYDLTRGRISFRY